jgi:hypothetical protein
MEPHQTALRIAEALLTDAVKEFHYTPQEAKGRMGQVTVLKQVAEKAIESCGGCNQLGAPDDNNTCPALVAYQEAKNFTVGYLPSSIGQNQKNNMGFGN